MNFCTFINQCSELKNETLQIIFSQSKLASPVKLKIYFFKKNQTKSKAQVFGSP